MTTIPLDQLRIASPCSMKWDDLEGAGAVRYCGECRLNVYNFSDMTREGIEQLISQHEGRLCAGFYRRADGTILTRDCPVGLRAIRAKTARALKRIAAAAGLLLTGGLALGINRTQQDGDADDLSTYEPFATVQQAVAPKSAPQAAVQIELGRVTPTSVLVEELDRLLASSPVQAPLATPRPAPNTVPFEMGGVRRDYFDGPHATANDAPSESPPCDASSSDSH